MQRKWIRRTAAMTACGCLLLGGCVVVPPRPRARVAVVAPAAVWVPGHWSRGGVWITGHWRGP